MCDSVHEAYQRKIQELNKTVRLLETLCAELKKNLDKIKKCPRCKRRNKWMD